MVSIRTFDLQKLGNVYELYYVAEYVAGCQFYDRTKHDEEMVDLPQTVLLWSTNEAHTHKYTQTHTHIHEHTHKRTHTLRR